MNNYKVTKNFINKKYNPEFIKAYQNELSI